MKQTTQQALAGLTAETRIRHSQIRVRNVTGMLSAWFDSVQFVTAQFIAPKWWDVCTRLHGTTCSFGQQSPLVSTSALLTQYLLLQSVTLLVVYSSDNEVTGETRTCRTAGKGLSSILGSGRMQKPYGRNSRMLPSLVYVPMLPLTMVSVLKLVRPFEFAVSRGPHVLFHTLWSIVYLVVLIKHQQKTLFKQDTYNCL